MQQLIRWLATLTCALALAACGGGGGGALSSSVPLAGDLSSPALAALVSVEPKPAPDADIVDGLILSRLDVAIAGDATVGQVNAALAAVGGTIDGALAGRPMLVIAVPRQADRAALEALADRLRGQSGILAVLMPFVARPDIAAPGPAGNAANFDHLQISKFPAAWNALDATPGLCANDRVTVIVADFFHRPIDALYAQFPAQLPGVTALGTGSVAAAEAKGFHGYDVLTTLAAALDAIAPTGANPFNDCLDLRALQMQGLTPKGIVLTINAALAATTGKVLLNTSWGFGDVCDDPCTPTSFRAPRAFDRAMLAASARALLAPMRDRVLITASAGNDANTSIGVTYPGTGIARTNSVYNVAATADSTMSFVHDTSLWDPTSPCAAAPCLPSLVATAPETAQLSALLGTLGAPAAARSDNVVIVGNVDHTFVRALDSEDGEDVSAVGEDIPTLLGVPTRGTSMAAPQVAALASHLWRLSPELRARPVQETISAIKETADGGIINAYAAVLSLDEAVAPTPTSARMRLAILDVDRDGDFDFDDLQAFHAAYVVNGAEVSPTLRDYSRFDLNGDGFTGGAGRTARMDLDPAGSTRFGAPLIAVAVLQGTSVTVNEVAVNDLRALCFFAYSALYTGSTSARDALVGDRCGVVPLVCPFGAGSYALAGRVTRTTSVVTSDSSLTVDVSICFDAAGRRAQVLAMSGTYQANFVQQRDPPPNITGSCTGPAALSVPAQPGQSPSTPRESRYSGLTLPASGPSTAGNLFAAVLHTCSDSSGGARQFADVVSGGIGAHELGGGRIVAIDFTRDGGDASVRGRLLPQ